MSISPNNGNSLFRLSVIGGVIIGSLHILAQIVIIFGIILKTPFIA